MQAVSLVRSQLDSIVSDEVASEGSHRQLSMPETGIEIAQGDGSPPDVRLAAHASGEHGISLMRCRFDKGLHVWGTSLHHMIFLTVRSSGLVACRIGDARLDHVAGAGNLTVCPEGALCNADGGGATEGFILSVPKDTLAFAIAERSGVAASLVERLKGEDAFLIRLAGLLARQAAEGFADGPLAWYELTNAATNRLIDAHLSEAPRPQRGLLDERALRRVIDCIHANVGRELGVAELADAARRSRSHFPRLFRHTVGLSPYQYVVKVRLERAISLLRIGRLSIAAIAAETGFADQSHMCRWMRRMYGAAPTRFPAARA
jgi:AraC family transcriptional regulator